MHAPTHELLSLSSDELAILTELLEAGRVELLVEIRHTHHRNYRDYLRKRVTLLERLIETVSHPQHHGTEHAA
ncbi:MAG TPA: hypothetical protein VK335_28220 [Bryobacteraceae bacterium]|nr:hypothetical protein [Bryobacteraceae bacterium]HZW93021.1 hypothetical protein [Candidatus Eremiobacteraceae bacterium]